MYRFKSIILCVLVFYGQFVFGQLPADKMYAHIIDVGQGMAVLMEFPQGAVLIDAGAAPDHEVTLINYLRAFFQRRTDLNNTLNGIIITHQHIDHNIALDDLTRNFKIQNYVDNGRRRVTNTEVNQIWMQNNFHKFGCRYEAITFDNARAVPNHTGLTDIIIDPVNGSTDPKIVIYSGAFVAHPAGWSKEEYEDPHNNSMVIKVTFGDASFLFSGDLEESGMKQVLDLYGGTDALKADVMQVGDHGSRSGISSGWISAVKPKYAFISCGHWDDGWALEGKPKLFTAFAYANPHVESVKLLEDSLTISRPTPFAGCVGTKDSFNGSTTSEFTEYLIHKLYCTAWDGTIVISATASGQYIFNTHQ
ncbi:Metal-dependent hydrolase, beta-lactamase superfamily II [Mucilaginibacter gossypiicola]|uniref:Metal-dependent hydrolase, beta-lactamase superfamily II n=1 Tax=Mucilaginibacter gossypiicola TaxID=551995 RepID=A0A1H8BNX3_9SPHI|nr:MBL fold metallo-hydrolase [Mucilaginibacter gossypiicola]SEM83597.1 Metal-dependent hydrolase, beta-lactamase superfamily II [Mucilaginibacter gossypiicola]